MLHIVPLGLRTYQLSLTSELNEVFFMGIGY